MREALGAIQITLVARDGIGIGQHLVHAAVALTALLSASATAQDKLYADEFPLGDVTLLDGPLKHARDLNIETLLKY